MKLDRMESEVINNFKVLIDVAAEHQNGYAWKSFDRSVNKGEKGLQILAPSPYKVTVEVTHDENNNPLPEPATREVQRMGFKVAHVFDVSQTSGNALPELAHRLTGQVGEYEKLMRALKQISPYPIAFEPIEGGALGFCSHKQRQIVIREGLSQEQTVKTTIMSLPTRCYIRRTSSATSRPSRCRPRVWPMSYASISAWILRNIRSAMSPGGVVACSWRYLSSL